MAVACPAAAAFCKRPTGPVTFAASRLNRGGDACAAADDDQNAAAMTQGNVSCMAQNEAPHHEQVPIAGPPSVKCWIIVPNIPSFHNDK
jgi:hypothetical protein